MTSGKFLTAQCLFPHLRKSDNSQSLLLERLILRIKEKSIHVECLGQFPAIVGAQEMLAIGTIINVTNALLRFEVDEGQRWTLVPSLWLLPWLSVRRRYSSVSRRHL